MCPWFPVGLYWVQGNFLAVKGDRRLRLTTSRPSGKWLNKEHGSLEASHRYRSPWPPKGQLYLCRWLTTRVLARQLMIWWRMPSSGMLRRVDLVRTGVSQELSVSFIRVTGVGELGTTLILTISSQRAPVPSYG
jgi:hypothetical protein